MSNPLPAILFVLLGLIGYGLFRPNPDQLSTITPFVAWLLASGFLSGSLRIAAQWEKALVFRLGKFRTVKGPGVFSILPFFDSVRLVDTRITTVAIPTQQAITKDNVPVSVDGVIFMRVESPSDAVIRIQNYTHAIRQYAQTALRDVIGALTLDEILADRERVGKRIEEMVEAETSGWGLEVAAIRIQDIVIPEDLKRVMSRQASAEREKRANITKSEGDREAANNLAIAAATMAASPGALQLRSLQTLDSLGTSPSNTVVLALPIEVMEALRAVPQLAGMASVPTSEGATGRATPAQPALNAPQTELDRDHLANAGSTASPDEEPDEQRVR